MLKTVNYDSGNEEHIKQLSSCTRTWRTKSRASTRRRWPSYSPAATSPPRHYSVHVHTKTASICPFEELCDFGVVVQKLGALTFVDEENAVGSTRWRTSLLRRNALGNAISVPVLRRLFAGLKEHLTRK